jgi:hypothetical protein
MVFRVHGYGYGYENGEREDGQTERVFHRDATVTSRYSYTVNGIRVIVSTQSSPTTATVTGTGFACGMCTHNLTATPPEVSPHIRPFLQSFPSG